MNKKISVIMGIFNCADTLECSVHSIQNQIYQNWELILCDDGSSDNTYEIAKNLASQDSRIVLLRNPVNMGLNYTLNRCLEYASGYYIARMDGDDTCSPDRFLTEIEVFDAEPELAVVSTGMSHFDDSGTWGQIQHPEYPTKKDFIYGSPFCHAPCMMRKDALDAVGGYSVDKMLLRVEDYHLWFKLYKAGFQGKNIPQVLYHMRDDRNAYARRKFKYRLNEAYVRALIVTEFHLPLWGYLSALRPILVGLLPSPLYNYLHKRNLKKNIYDKDPLSHP